MDNEERFQLKRSEYNKYSHILIDTLTGRELGQDGGEPEDNSFVRDWAWVVTELNILATELAKAQTLLAHHNIR